MALQRPRLRLQKVTFRPCQCLLRSNRGEVAHSRRRTLFAAPTRSLSSCGSHHGDYSEPELETLQAAPEISLNGTERDNSPRAAKARLKKLRVVPASPSYFTGRPQYTDDLIRLRSLLRAYQTFPLCKPSEAPRRAWNDIEAYRRIVEGEPVLVTKYAQMVNILRRLNRIHPSMMPHEVESAIQRFSRVIDPSANRPKPILIDEAGRARATGRRKSSSALVWLVEGDGQVLVNGKTLPEAFSRHHDRESTIWALKTTDRLDKYNVWALATGGGTTGQAEAITMGVGRALVAHEPLLKTQLRRGRFNSYHSNDKIANSSTPRSGLHISRSSSR